VTIREHRSFSFHVHVQVFVNKVFGYSRLYMCNVFAVTNEMESMKFFIANNQVTQKRVHEDTSMRLGDFTKK
jgi:hypothetical protein